MGFSTCRTPRVASKLGLSKDVDGWIFLATQFSDSTIDQFGSREDVALINLIDKSISGGLPSDNPLLQELMKIVESYENTPDRVSPSVKKGLNKPDQLIAASRARESTRVFNQHFQLSDCGHLQTQFYGRIRMGMYGSEPLSDRRPPTIEEKLEQQYPSPYYREEDTQSIMSEMEKYKDHLVGKLKESLTSDSIVPLVKQDLNGNLELDEACLLCKSCSQKFKGLYEFPEDPPIRGLRFAFKAFAGRVAKELQATESFNEMLDVGLIRTANRNLVLMMDPASQPTANITALDSTLVVVVCNFFWGRWREKRVLMRDLLGYSATEGGSGLWKDDPRTPDDPKMIVFKAVSNYLVPCLAYDCESDLHEYMEVKASPAETLTR